MLNYLFLAIIIQCFVIITTYNSILCILYLINVYLLIAIYFFILGLEFFGILLILVYVGAISILFIFVIMMLNLRVVEIYNAIIIYLPIGFFVILFFFNIIFYVIFFDSSIYSDYFYNFSENKFSWISNYIAQSHLVLLGLIFFNYFYYLLWFAGLILLLAMIGAIALTMDFNINKNIYKIQSSLYKTRKNCDRIFFWVYKTRNKMDKLAYVG